jgi:putative spermidine/putrescine transport system ATP-binding protein
MTIQAASFRELRLDRLSRNFGAHNALKDVSLTIRKGEFIALLGPSGCGKSTTLNLIAGLLPATGGGIWLDDKRIDPLRPEERGFGMVFQNYALFPHMNVRRNIGFGLKMRGLPKGEIDKRVDEAVALVKLQSQVEKLPGQLSGGQQQRVAIARAIVVEPPLVLMDEPLSNLDAKLRLEMRTEIRRIVKDCGLTGIYVTHDREEALSMGDRLAVMESGNLIQVGTPMDVYRNPVNRMVAEFMGETNFIEGTLLRDTSRVGLFDVETPVGILRGRTFDASFIPVRGQPVLLSIRPEALSFRDVPDSPNRLMGRITDTSYLGATVQYSLQANGHAMKLCDLNPEHVYPPSEQDIRMMVAPKDVIILRK